MFGYYLAVALLGAGAGIVVVGLAGRRAESQSGEDAAATADLRRQHLAEGLLRRLGAPLVERLVEVGRRFTPAARTDALRGRLDNAGRITSVDAFLSMKTLTSGAGLLLALSWALLVGPAPGRVLFAVLAGGAGGFLLPDLLLRRGGQARQREITRSMPDALDLLALTVEAGLGLEQGMAEVAQEVTGPLGDELDRMLKEQQLGRSRREALEALHARNRSEELRAFVDALLHAERLGAPMAATLRTQAREARRRRRASAREQAGKAPVKLLFPLILGIFPAMFVVILGPGAIRIAQSLLAR